MDVNRGNFHKICRTCFSSKSVISISDSKLLGEQIKVIDVLVNFIPFKDLTNPQLPQNICSLCCKKLNIYYNFKTECSQNQTILQSFLTKPTEPLSSLKKEQCSDAENDNKFKEDFCSSDDDTPLICRLKNTLRKSKGECNIEKSCSEYAQFTKNQEFEKHKICIKVSDDEIKNGYTCKYCNKSFTFKYKLIMHMRVHTKEKPFKCDLCNLTFSQTGNLRRHKMIHTGERPHICEICGKGFIQGTSLQAHSKKHEKENSKKKYTCNICCRVFIRLVPYNMHLKKYHSDDNVLEPEQKPEGVAEEKSNRSFDHICDICNRKFTQVIFLKRHISRHGEKKFLCSECGKGFVRKADLQSHLKVHTGEKPHTCAICNKSFAHAGSLVTHSLVHSGYKPYNCSSCSKSFTQLSHLKMHRRTHSGERPYSCTFCEKTFALKSNLTVHVRTHTGETPYLCNVCGKGFYDSSSMKKHKQSHYNLHNSNNVKEQSENLVDV